MASCCDKCSRYLRNMAIESQLVATESRHSKLSPRTKPYFIGTYLRTNSFDV